jgi:Domain of unknown function (DUF4160)
MPTLARIGPYRFFFYSNERDEPPHVPVQREAKIAKFWLDPVELAAPGGFPSQELRELVGLITEHREAWIEAWHEYFNS